MKQDSSRGEWVRWVKCPSNKFYSPGSSNVSPEHPDTLAPENCMTGFCLQEVLFDISVSTVLTTDHYTLPFIHKALNFFFFFSSGLGLIVVLTIEFTNSKYRTILHLFFPV